MGHEDVILDDIDVGVADAVWSNTLVGSPFPREVLERLQIHSGEAFHKLQEELGLRATREIRNHLFWLERLRELDSFQAERARIALVSHVGVPTVVNPGFRVDDVGQRVDVGGARRGRDHAHHSVPLSIKADRETSLSHGQLVHAQRTREFSTDNENLADARGSPSTQVVVDVEKEIRNLVVVGCMLRLELFDSALERRFTDDDLSHGDVRISASHKIGVPFLGVVIHVVVSESRTNRLVMNSSLKSHSRKSSLLVDKLEGLRKRDDKVDSIGVEGEGIVVEDSHKISVGAGASIDRGFDGGPDLIHHSISCNPARFVDLDRSEEESLGGSKSLFENSRNLSELRADVDDSELSHSVTETLLYVEAHPLQHLTLHPVNDGSGVGVTSTLNGSLGDLFSGESVAKRLVYRVHRLVDITSENAHDLATADRESTPRLFVLVLADESLANVNRSKKSIRKSLQRGFRDKLLRILRDVPMVSVENSTDQHLEVVHRSVEATVEPKAISPHPIPVSSLDTALAKKSPKPEPSLRDEVEGSDLHSFEELGGTSYDVGCAETEEGRERRESATNQVAKIHADSASERIEKPEQNRDTDINPELACPDRALH